MVATFGDHVPALSTVQMWAAEVKVGRDSKMTQGWDALLQPPPKKTLAMVTTW